MIILYQFQYMLSDFGRHAVEFRYRVSTLALENIFLIYNMPIFFL
jgi:hypothetical protein